MELANRPEPVARLVMSWANSVVETSRSSAGHDTLRSTLTEPLKLLGRWPELSRLDATTPGFAAVVARRGAIETVHRGLAQVEWGTAIGPDTRFHVASLAKQFTALAILQLRDQGRLTLDSLVAEIVPELASATQNMTVRHLLTHSSGLRDQWPLMEWAGWRGNDLITTDDVVRLLLRQRSPQFPPGSRWAYSNSGYTLLAEIVARLTGRSFAEYALAEIFVPLRMESTLIADDPTTVVSRRAEAYRLNGESGHLERSSPNLFVHGSTSLLTTSSDFIRWMLAHRDGSDWRPYIDEMQQCHILTDGSRIGYGLAYFLDEENGQPVAFHSGGDFGFTSFFAHYPTEDTTVAILANASLEHLRPVVRRLAEADRAAPASSPDDHPETSRSPGNTESTAGMVGVYAASSGEMRRIVRRNNGLEVIWGASQSLRATNTDCFLTPSGDTYRFLRNDSGAVDRFWHETPVMSGIWKRVGSTARDGRGARGRVGQYFSRETNALLEIVRCPEGDVALKLPKQGPVQLESFDDSLFFADAMWLRFDQGDARCLYLSMPRCQDVRYMRVSESS